MTVTSTTTRLGSAGGTDIDTGFLFCDVHHGTVHRQGWTVRLVTNGFPELVPPRSIDPQQRPRQHIRYRLRAAPMRT